MENQSPCSLPKPKISHKEVRWGLEDEFLGIASPTRAIEIHFSVPR